MQRQALSDSEIPLLPYDLADLKTDTETHPCMAYFQVFLTQLPPTFILILKHHNWKPL